MNTNAVILGTILFCVSFVSCEEDDNNLLNYDQEVIINADLYNTAPSDFQRINSVKLIGNSLLINFSSSGCSGESWDVKLIDAEVILKTNPPQRNLRLSLDNKELCEAYITKEISFDISQLQIDDNQVILNFTNYTNTILYEY